MRNTRGIPTDYTAQLIEDSDDETGFPGVPKIAKKCRFSCTLCQKRFVRAVHLENHVMWNTTLIFIKVLEMYNTKKFDFRYDIT